jgi:hypothetical protein
MAPRRWLIAIGAVVLAGMLLCGAFSLGVFAGRRGLSGDTLRTSPEAEPLLRLCDEFGQPDVLGRVRRATSEVLDLATSDGPRSVQMNAGTQLFDEGSAAMSITDLRPGDLVAVYGELNGTAGRAFTARVVVRLPPRVMAEP